MILAGDIGGTNTGSPYSKERRSPEAARKSRCFQVLRPAVRRNSPDLSHELFAKAHGVASPLSAGIGLGEAGPLSDAGWQINLPTEMLLPPSPSPLWQILPLSRFKRWISSSPFRALRPETWR
jgi:hypothetical protein